MEELQITKEIRTIIPARGRKLWNFYDIIVFFFDKNHNPRKGTETYQTNRRLSLLACLDKNHNPRKGTETWGLLRPLRFWVGGR